MSRRGAGARAAVPQDEAVDAEVVEPLPERGRRLHLDGEHLLPLAPVDRQDLVGLEPGRGAGGAGFNGTRGVLWKIVCKSQIVVNSKEFITPAS